MPPHSVYAVLGSKPRDSFILGKPSTNRAIVSAHRCLLVLCVPIRETRMDQASFGIAPSKNMVVRAGILV